MQHSHCGCQNQFILCPKNKLLVPPPCPHFLGPEAPGNLSSEGNVTQAFNWRVVICKPLSLDVAVVLSLATSCLYNSCLLPNDSANLLWGEKQAYKWTNHNVRLQRWAGKSCGSKEGDKKPVKLHGTRTEGPCKDFFWRVAIKVWKIQL